MGATSAARGRRAARGAVTAPQFAGLMARLGPFEPAPTVAVAVSGGRDSLALAMLARDWAAARGGHAVALTVDHGLRQESAREAREVGRWLERFGMRQYVLRWRGPRPRANVQAAAREARYRLLAEWCRSRGILHLLLAHHREDQAETLLLRLARGSGIEGLSAMPLLAEGPDLRLLRPLLAMPRERLAATCRLRGQPWFEDPSNRDLAHARVRVRALLPALAAEGLTAERLAAAARHLGRARAALEQAAAAVAARCVQPMPPGYLWLDLESWAQSPAEIALRVLARALLAVSGRAYPPRLERLERLYEELKAGLAAGGRTLAGCRIVKSGGRLLVCREWARAAERLPVPAGARLLWDGRFLVLRPRPAGRSEAVERRGDVPVVARLGPDGWAEIRREADPRLAAAIPAAVRPSLPALWVGAEVLACPHLGLWRDAAAAGLACRLSWRPPLPLAGAGFTVA